jgi:hypothetical protein
MLVGQSVADRDTGNNCRLDRVEMPTGHIEEVELGSVRLGVLPPFDYVTDQAANGRPRNV